MEANTIKKPKWLRRLERESWQGELVISGLAIYGSLQLPSLVEAAAQWTVFKTGDGRHFLLYMIFFYLAVSANVLIFTFITHFILRALWIGLLGLNSVFPNGIKRENKMYPPYFMDKALQEFPNNNLNISGLDKVCSVLFAFSAYLVLIILAITIDLGILSILIIALNAVLPKIITQIIVGLFLTFFFGVVFANFLFNSKSFRGKPIAKKYHYRISTLAGKIMLHVFYRPANYIGFTFLSNINLGQYIKASAFFFFSVLAVTMFQLISGSSILYVLHKDKLLERYERIDRTHPEVYEETRIPEDGYIVSAMIESERISGDYLKVFVPVLRGEKGTIENLCGEWSSDPQLDDTENQKNRWQFWLDCYTKYHRFYVNDTLYDVEIVKHTHRNRGEFGILTYIPTQNFKKGKNLLKVEKVGAGGKVARTMNIPFWY